MIRAGSIIFKAPTGGSIANPGEVDHGPKPTAWRGQDHPLGLLRSELRELFMPTSGPGSTRWVIAGALLGLTAWGGSAGADNVILKDGNVIRGIVDKDNTLIFVSDSLKRTVFYNSKVARIEPDDGFQRLERFQLIQPLEVHGGVMPPAAVEIVTTPWDAKGRRGFQYKNNRSAKVAMQQAINDLSPHMTMFRGIDGFWKGQVATSEIPRAVILGLLAKVDQTNETERKRVVRFLIQSQWFDEARTAIDQLERDFPNLKETLSDVRRDVAESQARDTLIAAATARRALQPVASLRLLRSIANRDLSRDLLDETREAIRKDEDQEALDRGMADRLRDLADKLSEADRPTWKGRIAEVLFGIAQVPDVARTRLDPILRADAASASAPPEARLALALSSWVVGPEAAVDTLNGASARWQAREWTRNYLTGRFAPAPSPRDPKTKDAPKPPDDPAQVRADAVVALNLLEQTDKVALDTLDLIVARMLPPLDEPRDDTDRSITTHRVADDENPAPTEYAVLLPPEYQPLRSYPAVIVLHDGRGPRSAVEWVANEASKRGYIVVAPEYNTPAKGKGYHYSSEEHAAVQLSLRDARKRYAIDSNRVFLAGQLTGADMAWDFGLAHPDLFAGVVAVSGFPAKYAFKYKAQIDKVPLYVVLGELAPAARELIFDKYVRPLIEDVKDVTFVDYLKRGLEALPEEVPACFDWMAGRRRDPAPKSFDVATARDSDARFFGVIVQEIAPGRMITPEAADLLGNNIRPATIKLRSSVQGNLLNLTTSGINRLDVWLSPKLVDFKRKVEVRQSDKVLFKGLVKPDVAVMLEDLRSRGDRQQLYHAKITPNGPKPRGR